MNVGSDYFHFFTVYEFAELYRNRDDFLRKKNGKEINKESHSHDNPSHNGAV